MENKDLKIINNILLKEGLQYTNQLIRFIPNATNKILYLKYYNGKERLVHCISNDLTLIKADAVCYYRPSFIKIDNFQHFNNDANTLEILREANETEKALFVDRLAAYGYRLNKNNEIEKAYVPNNGDICYVKTNLREYVLIIHNIFDMYGFYVGVELEHGTPKYYYKTDVGIAHLTEKPAEIRLATEAEKNLLFNEMHQHSDSWDSENNKVVIDHNWRAEKGYMYESILIDVTGTVKIIPCIEQCTYIDCYKHKTGNYYNPCKHKETEQIVERIKNDLKNAR